MRKIGKFSGARLRAYAVLISPFCGDAPRRAAIRSLTEYPSCPSDAVAASILTAEAQETARALRVQLQIVKAGAEGDFETDFAYLAQLHVDGLTVGADPFVDCRYGIACRQRYEQVARVHRTWRAD